MEEWFLKAKKFVYQNARPLDLARWKYLFENGSKSDVLNELKKYENEDGGFGHALEVDCWNPHSSPIQTWVATEILRELNVVDANEPMITKIIGYLENCPHYDGHFWANSIPTNNNYPHAPWWNYSLSDKQVYNPTPSLAGFIVRFANKNSYIYKEAVRIIKEAYSFFKNNLYLNSMHTVDNFVILYEYLCQCEDKSIVDLDEFKSLLQAQVNKILTYDTDKWKKEYVCKPSFFMNNRASMFYEQNKDLADKEVDFILDGQLEDGSWNVNWAWDNYENEWQQSCLWWKSDIIINNCLYIKGIKKFGVNPNF